MTLNSWWVSLAGRIISSPCHWQISDIRHSFFVLEKMHPTWSKYHTDMSMSMILKLVLFFFGCCIGPEDHQNITSWWFQIFFIVFTLTLGKLSYVWTIFFRWVGEKPPTCCHPELHPQVLNHEPRGREPGNPWGLGDSDDETKTPPRCDPGWWQLKHVVFFKPYLGKWSNLTFAYFFHIGLVKNPPTKICVWGICKQQKRANICQEAGCIPMCFF